MIGPYKTPQAFRVALETRLRQTAQERGVAQVHAGAVS